MLQLLRRVRAAGDLVLGVLYCFIGRLLPALRPAEADLGGKTVVVTGGNSGVGYGIGLQLARMGARVFLACRNKERAERARAAMVEACGRPDADVRVLPLDNASLDSVRGFAQGWTHGRIDVLVHNAGIAMRPSSGGDGGDSEEFTEDGLEIMYQVNFLSSFLLTALLDAHLAPDARVIFTTSVGGYVGVVAAGHALAGTPRRLEPGFHVPPGVATNDSARYAQTKLMQSAYARALQARWATGDASSSSSSSSTAKSGRRAFSFEPGLVLSNVFTARPPFTKDPMYWFLVWLQPKLGVEPLQGAATAVHLATSGEESVVGGGGRYFDRMKPRHHFVDLWPQERLDKLWIRWAADAGLGA